MLFARLLQLLLCKLLFRRLWVTLLPGKRADIPRWNIATTIKVSGIFGILKYLEYWNIKLLQPLSRSLEYWNIWNIEIFGILEYLEHWNIGPFGILDYLEHWNIATTLKVFLLLLRERTSEHGEFSNEESKSFCIFKQLERLRPRDTWSKISRFGSSSFFTETFLDTEAITCPGKLPPTFPQPHTHTHLCVQPNIPPGPPAPIYNSTCLHVWCLHSACL